MMKYEKPQKSNPHKLTINQHTLPVASITRFVNGDGVVSVYHIRTGKHLTLPPENQLFCAKRVWDQRAEEGYMKEIEHEFQRLAERILAGAVVVVGSQEKKTIDDFFVLLVLRTQSKANPPPDRFIPGILQLEHNLTKDEQELLEKNHINFIRPDFTFPGRQLTGINIQQNILRIRKQTPDAPWGVLVARSGEFIVPDSFAGINVVPLNPTHCLLCPSQYREITRSELVRINRQAVIASREYYFARDLSSCPR